MEEDEEWRYENFIREKLGLSALIYYQIQKTMNMKVTTTTTTQTANEVLGKKEQKLYYLILENKKGEKHIINVGEKTHNKVEELTKNDK